MIKYNYR